MELIGAVYSEGRVVVPALNEANSLYQDGYGSLLEGRLLTLSPFEALYLVEAARMAVTDEESRRRLTFQELLSRFAGEDPHLWTLYLVYRDLRSRGFVARGGPGLGVDLLVYERGAFGRRPPRYLVYAVSEGTPEPLRRLREVLKAAEAEGRILRIAVVDRRGEVVYYTLSYATFTEAEETGEAAPSP